MLTLPSSGRVFLAIDAVDMRGSFDALAGRVRRLGLDPQDGHLYVFVNHRRVLMKVLFFDRSGWCILAKRLERGTFQIPRPASGQHQLTIDPATLGMILEGVDLAHPPRRERYVASTTWP
ncbi:MAG TPA: IS66 family insertion sequence element accessory protein TnpB [Myxococcota bacterium]|nr:IS66 family insertion sequence element accessory protein TnpB [Myxococcota bacterium]